MERRFNRSGRAAPGRPSRATRPAQQPAAGTSWDPLATWYTGWVGEEGSEHHRELAIPAVMDALGLAAGERVLDIGCGPGVLSQYVARAGASYVGVDASPRLLDYARKTHGSRGRFLLGDAASLDTHEELSEGAFDAAVFLLSIQDMEPLERVIAGAAWALRPGGRLVILMTHPCFRIPRQSGWGWDEGRKLVFRRVDHYLTPLGVPLKAYSGKQEGVTRSFHRPLGLYVGALAGAGLLVDRMDEMPTYKKAAPGPSAKAENRAHAEIPLFLSLRARKSGDVPARRQPAPVAAERRPAARPVLRARRPARRPSAS
jgi:SAM-dependent methyltransferase